MRLKVLVKAQLLMHKFFFGAFVNLLFMVGAQAEMLELRGELTQGSLLRGSVPAGSEIWLDGKTIMIGDDGNFAFGFSRDDKLTHQLKWRDPQGKNHEKSLILIPREYDIQRIEGLPSKMVSPPEAVLTRIKQANVQVAQARAKRDRRSDFAQNFIWPAQGPISGVYGSQRVLNGQPKRPHYGVDVAAPTGTPVYAPADGVVTLFVPDMYYSGGTMIIDHGLGVSSTFLHLSKGLVTVGDHIKQGQLVAEIGATGRVTGAHLDWRMNWMNVRLDPALLVPKR